jgi:hypothetical protein
MKRTTGLIICILLIAFDATFLILLSKESNPEMVFSFRMPDIDVKKYGFYYPITFEFLVNDTFTPKYRYLDTDLWNSVLKKSSGLCNGNEVYRVENNTMYISLSFRNHTKLQIGTAKGSQFVEITKYYDNRKAVVVHTVDDAYGNEENSNSSSCLDLHLTAIDSFQSSQNLVTLGIIPAMSREHFFSNGIVGEPYPMSPYAWQKFQEQIDEGFVSVCSHSYTHSTTFPSNINITQEVEQSKQDIIENLHLPYGQYVYGWIEPYGNGWFPQELSNSGYLVSRVTGTPQGVSYTGLAEYSKEIGMFQRYGTTGSFTPYTTVNYKQIFDDVYNQCGVFHLFWHCSVWSIDEWSNQTSIVNDLLRYTGGKTDIWYVGFGELYCYTYAKLICTEVSAS